jgi:hypothetical protein
MEMWSCAACTFENEPTATVCNIWQSPRTWLSKLDYGVWAFEFKRINIIRYSKFSSISCTHKKIYLNIYYILYNLKN